MHNLGKVLKSGGALFQGYALKLSNLVIIKETM